MPVLTNAQVATLQRVLATANNVLPRIEMLEGVARVNTSLTQRVAELRAQREYLVQLATATLEIERQLGGQVAMPPVATSSGVSWSPPPPPPYNPGMNSGGVTAFAPTVYSPAPMAGPATTSSATGTGRIFVRSTPPDQAETDVWFRQGYRIEQGSDGNYYAVRP